MNNEQDLVYRLRKRADIRRQIASRKSVQEGKPDRLADLLDEAALEIEQLRVADRDESDRPLKRSLKHEQHDEAEFNKGHQGQRQRQQRV